MAKAKTKTKKKATKLPVLECSEVMDARFGMYEDASGVQATRLTAFEEDEGKWKIVARKHLNEGGTVADCPTLPASKFPNPNTGGVSRNQNDALCDKWNAGEEVAFAPVYNPILVDMVHATGCTRLRRGSVKLYPKPPKDWDEKKYGSWYHLDDEGEEHPSGWFFDTDMPRRAHAERVELLVENPDENIVTVGGNRYAVGTGSHDGSAVFLVRAHSRGNYGSIDGARKRMSLGGIKGLINLVFKIEDKPNNGGAFVLKSKWRSSTSFVRAIAFMPGQVMTPGYLSDSDGKEMTPAQVRKAATDEAKGTRFKACEPIVGNQISWLGEEGLWAEIQVAEGRKGIAKLREREGRSEYEAEGDITPQSKTIKNAFVECRLEPNEHNPFGIKSLQIGMIPTYQYDADGEFSMGVVIGERSAYEYNISKRVAKRGEEEEEVPEKKVSTKKRSSGKKKVIDAAPVEEAVSVVEEEAEVEEVAAE